MAKFPVGERVRLSRPSRLFGGALNGLHGSVIDNKNTAFPMVAWDDFTQGHGGSDNADRNDIWGFSESALERAPLRVGEKVRVCDTDAGNAKGLTGFVHSIDDQSNKVTAEFPGWGRGHDGDVADGSKDRRFFFGKNNGLLQEGGYDSVASLIRLLEETGAAPADLLMTDGVDPRNPADIDDTVDLSPLASAVINSLPEMPVQDNVVPMPMTANPVADIVREVSLKPQTKTVLKHLRRHTITPMEALTVYGISRLAAAVNDLRKEGWAITTERKHDEAGHGYARYTLVGEPINVQVAA